MAALPESPLISIDEYLDTSYEDGDREFVDGQVVERNVGERPHSLAQRNLLVHIQNNFSSLLAWPEQRVLTVPGRRSRVPDVCVTEGDPGTNVFDKPPLIVIEILSRRDEPADVLQKLAEYHAFGVPHIWVIDPRHKRAFQYEKGGLEEVQSALAAGYVQVPLEAVFQGV